MAQDDEAPSALAVADHHPAPPRPRRASSPSTARAAAAALARPCRRRRRLLRHRPRGPPDLTLCHCCGVRFPPPQPQPAGAKQPRRRPVRPLPSLWRVVLLCAECLSLDNPPPEDSAVSCRRCDRFVHRSCIPAEHRTAVIQPVGLEDFLCVDCCPTVRPKAGGFNLGLNLVAYPRDPTSVAGGGALRKAGEVRSPSKWGKDAAGTGDPVLLDEEFALQLHLAMNGSQRISRSGSSSTGASVAPGKGKNTVVAGRNGNGNLEICVTNMMAQLDDEEEPGCDNRVWRSGSPITVVLALECVKGKHAEEGMKAKRKGPPVILKQDDSVNRYKKQYSKRSKIKAKVEHTPDIDSDHGDGGVAPMK